MKGRRRGTLFAITAGSILLLLAALAAFAASGSAAGQAAPKPINPPTITGTPQEGQKLTGDRGTWSGSPTEYIYSWMRCDSTGGSCSRIRGATALTYVVTSADVRNTIRFRVEAKNKDGSTSASSVPTAVVRAAPKPPAAGCAGTAPVQVASISPPERLSVDEQQIQPTIVGRSTETITVRFHVACRGKAVQGALVYATAVPFNQFTIPPEQPTGADGWVQLTMTQLSGYPAARRQQLLVVFVRARKPGENALGGISTRRLVSFPVDLRR